MSDISKNRAGVSKTVIFFILLIASVLAGSLLSVGFWGGKAEKAPESITLAFDRGMTIGDFGKANNLPGPVMKKAFDLKGRKDLDKTLSSTGLSNEEISGKINRALALYSEDQSKNWVKIRIKFILWIVFLLLVFSLIRKNRVGPLMRKILYLAAILLFGVILGADPSPMGTVKDAIALYGAQGVIFKPRMVALTIFLATIFLANKFICSWGCQFGTLQDLVFRLNRNREEKKEIFRQYKPSFAITNSVRVLFFIAFTLVAFLWAADITESIDPFKLFKPATIGLYGGIFMGTLLVLSLFIYRPWCHLFCPMGLVGWLLEKISLFKIKVDYESCIACKNCARACPSTVMKAILLREQKVIPDCFACGTCMDVCPSESISFSFGKRTMPPEDKFSGKAAG